MGSFKFRIPRHIREREAAKRFDRGVQAVCTVVAVACVLGAAWLVPGINAARKRNQLIINPDSVAGLPSGLRLLTKLGTVRALAIDAAAIRMERLKNENRYYELMQLSDWLCDLAPRYPMIWRYASWNQAYNISVTQYTPEARWKWVSNGIRILRDRGIPYNPKAIGLYRELAWTYWHKVGDFTDDYHWAYKKELAVEMERVLGAPVIALTEQDTQDAFRKIVEAPRDLDRLLHDDPQVVEFCRRLAEVGLKPDRSLLEFVARYLRDDIQIAGLLKLDENDPQQKLLLQRTRLLTAPRSVPVRDRLLAALRSHALRTTYHMDVDYMLELMKEYGPVDWRLPYGMSLYWASYGDKVTQGIRKVDPSESMNTVRLIFFSLDSMVRKGRLVLEPNFDKPNQSFIQLLPDARFIRHTHEAMLKYGKVQMDTEALRSMGNYPILINFRAGHVNFLRYSIRQLWWLGTPEARADAREYYQWLREYDRDPHGRPKAFYMQPIEAAVMEEIYQGLTSFKNAQMIINDFLFRSLEQLALGDLPSAEGYLNIARQGWEYYMQDKTYDIVNRRFIPPLDRMRQDATVVFLQNPGVPILEKVRLWRRLDVETRQFCYDRVLPYMTRLAAEHVPPLKLEAVYAEPPGMEDYRKQEAEPERTEPTAPPAVSHGEKPPS